MLWEFYTVITVTIWLDVIGRLRKRHLVRTKKTTFILIAGKAGVGKTTLGEYLARELSGIKGISVVTVPLAYSLKRVATSAFGWDGEKDAKGRRLLQIVGTDAGREYDENIWVRKTVDFATTSSVFPPNFVIVDDWRYPNECSYIEDLGIHNVVTVRVEASSREILKGTREAKHISETSLPCGYGEEGSWYDFVVSNQDSFDSLYCQGKNIMSYLLENFILE